MNLIYANHFFCFGFYEAGAAAAAAAAMAIAAAHCAA